MDDVTSLEPSILGALWRYRWIVLGCLLLALGLGLGYTWLTPDTFTARATLVVQNPQSVTPFQNTASGSTRPDRYLASQVDFLGTTLVAQRAAELAAEPGLDARDFQAQTTVASTLESDVLGVLFTDGEAERAQIGANSVVAAYQDLRGAEAERLTAPAIEGLQAEVDEIDVQIDQLEQELVDAGTDFRVEARARRLALEQEQLIETRGVLQQRLSELQVNGQLASAAVTPTVSPATLPQASASGLIRSLVIALVLGALVGTALAYLLALRSRRLGNRNEPALVLDAPLLAEVPDFNEERLRSQLPVATNADSASAEAFRFAAGAVDIRMGALRAKSLVAVSGLLGEGKSTVVANTALAIARQGHRVLVIDADFGNQAVSQLLLGNSVSRYGLTELVAGQVPLERVLRRAEVLEGTNVSVLSRGRLPVVAPDFLQSPAAQAFLRDIRLEFDLVLIDAPPVLQVAYASSLVRQADAAMVVVGHGSQIEALEELAERLRFIGTPIAGYVYNKAPLRAEMLATEGSMADILGTDVTPTAAASNGSGATRHATAPDRPVR